MMEIEHKERSKRVLYFKVKCYCPHCGEAIEIEASEQNYSRSIRACDCGAIIESYLDGTYMTLTFTKSEDEDGFNIAAKSEVKKK